MLLTGAEAEARDTVMVVEGVRVTVKSVDGAQRRTFPRSLLGPWMTVALHVPLNLTRHHTPNTVAASSSIALPPPLSVQVASLVESANQQLEQAYLCPALYTYPRPDPTHL